MSESHIFPTLMFKITPLLWLASVVLLAPSTWAKPAQNSATKLPASVAATMPTQILDIATYKIAPAPGAPKLLIHLWSAPRRNPNAGGTFHASPGTFKGKVTVEEVNSFDSLYLSPFVYDIFAPNGKGGWTYLNSIVHNDTSAAYPPQIRYLNNKTKQGLIIELGQFGGQYASAATLYVLPRLEPGYQPRIRDFSRISAPSNAGSVSRGFGRDARGFAQLIKAETGTNEATKQSFETRTISTWNEETNDWKDGRPVVVARP